MRLYSATLRVRFLIAYMGVFAITLLAFALAVHVAFATSLQQQTTGRLVALAGAGLTDVSFTKRPYLVARRIDRVLLRGDEEGLEWFDARENVIASRGLVPPRTAPPRVDRRETFQIGSQRVYTYTVALRDSRGTLRGFVRASEADTEYASTLQRLDRDIAISALLALVLSAVAGYALSAQATQRIEANIARLAEFTADASHELRGPLTAIASNVDATLRDEQALPSGLRRRLIAISGATAQMRRLTDDLLLLARAGQPMESDLFVVDLGTVIKRVHALYDAQARAKEITLTGQPTPTVLVHGNPDQLQRIIANLTENAIRYTNAGGHVTLQCGRARSEAFVRVVDDGIGIAAEFHHRIFDRFWRGDQSRSGERGAGLGLSVALALARRHGGTINVVSAPNRGSAFTLFLKSPVPRPRHAASPQSPYDEESSGAFVLRRIP